MLDGTGTRRDEFALDPSWTYILQVRKLTNQQQYPDAQPREIPPGPTPETYAPTHAPTESQAAA
jgi:hypothetical protein